MKSPENCLHYVFQMKFGLILQILSILLMLPACTQNQTISSDAGIPSQTSDLDTQMHTPTSVSSSSLVFSNDFKLEPSGWQSIPEKKPPIAITETADYSDGAYLITLMHNDKKIYHWADTQLKDMRIETSFDLSASETEGGVMLYCRIKDENNQYVGGWLESEDGRATYGIGKMVNGKITILGTSMDFSQSDNLIINELVESNIVTKQGADPSQLTLSFDCRGDWLILSINDVPRVIVQDKTFKSGDAGFGYVNIYQKKTTLVLTGLDIYDLSLDESITDEIVLLPLQSFEVDQKISLCNLLPDAEKSQSGFAFNCKDGQMKIGFHGEPPSEDSFSFFGFPVSSPGFVLEADVISTPDLDTRKDENVYGFFFVTGDEKIKSWQFAGPYYQLTEYYQENNVIKALGALNNSFSPSLKFANQTNHFKIAYHEGSCDLWVNEILTARITNEDIIEITAIGLFTAASREHPFNSVQIKNLHIYIPLTQVITEHTYVSKDDLLSDKGTFSQTGLSGAFSTYEEDGFHFSPVISYGYYGVKADPGLADMSVSVSVLLNQEHSSESMYAGVVCRSSQDGKYIAVVRSNGTYSIFRDTPKRPFALLAQKKSKAVNTDTGENTLHLDCIETTINFFINGIRVESFQDTRFNLLFGRGGIFTKAGRDPHEDAIVFKDLFIKEIH
ncbi:MAG TPA: hypothetical protein G4N92_09580 [Anaerolineae bacterium]|nr:hypothetical protein [Anaerolineae bacterium]